MAGWRGACLVGCAVFAKRSFLGAMADVQSGFAAAKLADIKNRMRQPL
jgi:hypothetical protein